MKLLPRVLPRPRRQPGARAGERELRVRWRGQPPVLVEVPRASSRRPNRSRIRDALKCASASAAVGLERAGVGEQRLVEEPLVLERDAEVERGERALRRRRGARR